MNEQNRQGRDQDKQETHALFLGEVSAKLQPVVGWFSPSFSHPHPKENTETQVCT